MLPLQGEKPQNRPLSNLNNWHFALLVNENNSNKLDTYPPIGYNLHVTLQTKSVLIIHSMSPLSTQADVPQLQNL